MAGISKKSFAAPEQTFEFDKFRAEIVIVGGIQVARCTCQPGWVWSKSVGPAMGGAQACPLPHPVWLVLSGRFAVRMNDGETVEYGPGELGEIAPGHDAWVVGDEPCVALDVNPHPQG